MQPYSFVAAKEGEQYFIIDMHVVSCKLGGKQNLKSVQAEFSSCKVDMEKDF